MEPVEQGEPAGSVVGLYVTPTKGFAVRKVPSVEVTPTGILGNREFFLVDIDEQLYSVPKDPVFLHYWTRYSDATGVLSIGRGDEVQCSGVVRRAGRLRQFAFDERLVWGWWAPGPWDDMLSALAGRHLRLARCSKPGDGHDVHPVTVLSTASLTALGTELDGRGVDVRRFRLNVVVDIGDQPFREDGWGESAITVGGCTLQLRGGIPRCLAVEHRPDDADRGLRMQRRIREVRGTTPSTWGPSVLLGVYADVLAPGRIALGDPVALRTWPSPSVGH